MFDYAYHNQKILNNESIVIYDRHHHNNDQSSIARFKSNFNTLDIDGFGCLDSCLSEVKADAVYFIKGGANDGRTPTACRSLIHAVAMAGPDQKHGDRWAYVSEWMSIHFGSTVPFVPYMIDVPDISGDLRHELGIPQEAIVFGRTGGMDTWNIPWVNDAICDILRQRNDVYFLFQNTPRFSSHKRVIHIPTTSDIGYKVKFINTCDAMVHARHEGESFGCACGEFSVRNKPIITWSGSPERNHIFILKNKGIYYSDKNEFTRVLLNFHKQPDADWNCYRDYSPERVMEIFKRVFLD